MHGYRILRSTSRRRIADVARATWPQRWFGYAKVCRFSWCTWTPDEREKLMHVLHALLGRRRRVGERVGGGEPRLARKPRYEEEGVPRDDVLGSLERLRCGAVLLGEWCGCTSGSTFASNSSRLHYGAANCGGLELM